MTRDDILRMAREVGAVSEVIAMGRHSGILFTQHELEHFAALVAALVAAAEREACAKVCSDRAMRCESEAQRAIENGEHDEVSAIRSTAWQISVCAAAIRARGQQ